MIRGRCYSTWWVLCWLLCVSVAEAAPESRPSPPNPQASQRTQGPQAPKLTQKATALITYINDHTGLDTGWYPELRYRIRYDWWLDIEAGLRLSPPGDGDLLRYYLMASVHIKMPPVVRDFAFRVGLMHSSYLDIQRGENLIALLNHFDTKHFSFTGGLGIRFPLTTEASFHNPFHFAAPYVEATLLFDFRGKLEFTFPQLGGSVLRVGLGIMDFLPGEILVSNTIGYQLFAEWTQPKIGAFNLAGGMMAYTVLDLAGFYGRWFVRAQYSYIW